MGEFDDLIAPKKKEENPYEGQIIDPNDLMKEINEASERFKKALDDIEEILNPNKADMENYPYSMPDKEEEPDNGPLGC